MNIHQLVYISKATTLFSEGELLTILSSARKKNQNEQVTGLLLYKDKSFIQLLEGPKEAVAKIFSTVEMDPRHYRINTFIANEKVNERCFPDWNMGFKNLEQSTKIEHEGYLDVFENGFDFGFSETHISSSIALKLLMHFRRSS